MSQRKQVRSIGAVKVCRGSSLIEVMVAILIMTFGILGLAGLQSRAQTAEIESYQRQQALILLDDMASRMANNKDLTNTIPATYVTGTATGSALGTGDATYADATNCSALPDLRQQDQCEWSRLLRGASEKKGTSNLGAMINARGCILETVAGKEYTVVVVWQGLNRTVVPATACGSASYDSEDTRRAVTTIVRVPDLAAS